MSTKYPQGVITATPPFQSTTAQSFSGVWTLEQLGKNYFYYQQPVAKSLRFRSSATAYLSRTPSTGSNRTTWTWSGWVKIGLIQAQTLFEAQNGTTFSRLQIDGNLNFSCVGGTSAVVTTFNVASSAVIRDPSSWYHFVAVFDTTQATAANRIKLYINGVQVTSFSSSTYPNQNTTWSWNAACAHDIGRYVDSTYGAGGYLDGYLAEVNFIDGLALDPSYFGVVAPATGVWAPKKYVGSYGGNGFYLPFTDATSTTTLGYDSSGNSNNWTTNNISLTSGSTYDSMWDSPTSYDNGVNGVGNYCVGNPLQIQAGGSFSDGNLTVSIANGSYYSRLFGTIGVSSGKWYWEFTQNANNATMCGIASSFHPATASGTLGYYSDEYAYYGTGQKYNNGSLTSYGASYTTNDVLGVALDLDAGTLTFYKNNTSQGVAFSSLPTGTYFPALGSASGTSTGWWNFGQRPFAYTPPTGFKALNTQNLPAVSIANGANHMAATLYTGNGGTQSIINAYNSVSFKPDFVWAKARSNAQGHTLFDSVRGASKYLQSNSTNAEGTFTAVPSFNSDGFTSTTDVSTNGYTYAAWQWKAGGTAVTNTAGSITSSVSANPTAGFSVVTYTGNNTAGATVGHGLGVAPSMIIVKSRATSSYWFVYHVALGATQYLSLNATDAAGSTVTLWNNTAPTSSVITLGTNSGSNNSGTMVAYCFAAIPGYSAFGSYTGNGSSDGPFVYCGFRPRWLLIKDANAVGAWIIEDSSRDTYNVDTKYLVPNNSDAEGSATLRDMLSNGFKARSTSQNTNGTTYIYAAFAENPFKYSLAR